MQKQTFTPPQTSKLAILLVVSSIFLIISVGVVWGTVTDSFIGNYSQSRTISQSNSGLLNNVSVYNSSWLEFDGINDYVDIPVETFNNKTWTISIWLKTINASVQDALWMSDSSTSKERFRLEYDGTKWTFYDDYNLLLSTSVDVPINTWQHIAVTYDYDNQVAKLYYNTTVYVTDSSFSQQPTGSGSFQIGKRSTTDFEFNGTIAYVNVYNKTLNSSQIKRLYEEPPFQKNLGLSIPAFNLHRLSTDDVNSEYVWNVSRFNELVDYLHANGYQTITFKDYYNWRTYNNFTMPKKPIILVFDDSVLSEYTIAYPKLSSYGYVAVDCIITDRVGKEGNMTWSQLAELRDAGWEMCSHSVDHWNLLNYEEDTWKREFNLSKIYIEGNLSVNVTYYQYSGNHNNITIDNICSEYYPMCIGDTVQVGDNPVKYNYKSSNMTHSDLNNSLSRLYIINTTTAQDVINYLDYKENLVFSYKFGELSGTSLLDSSGNNNHGTISGATWKNDSIKLNLSSSSYWLSGNQFTLLDAFYDKSYMMMDYNCVVIVNRSNVNFTEDYCENQNPLNYTKANSNVFRVGNLGTGINQINITMSLYSSCFNSTSSTPQCTETTHTCNSTIGSNQRVVCLEYEDERKWISGVDTTVSDVYYSYDSEDKVLTVTVLGSGSVNLSYLSNLIGLNEQYAIHKDGKFVTYSSSDTAIVSRGVTTFGAAVYQVQTMNATERMLLFCVMIVVIVGIISFSFIDGRVSLILGIIGLAIAILVLRTMFGG